MTRSAGIIASTFSLPAQTLTYEQLEERFGAQSMKKVLSGSGIRHRRVADNETTGADLAFQAATRLLNEFDISRDSIDLLIHCTQTPDHFLPTTACILHDRLKLSKQCAAFDINLGCSQYVYALAVAHGMIVAGTASRALVLTGDTLSKTLNPRDRSVVPILGDGGSASLVSEVPEGQGFLGFELGTDGSGHSYLTIPAGAFRLPLSPQTAIETTDAEGNVRSPQNLFMSGATIFHFAISTVPEVINRLLDKLNLTIDNIDLFIFHQANKYMLDYLFRKLKIPMEKTHVFLEDVGNSSGTTVPVVLTEAWRAGKIRAGALVLLIGFGVGLSWGATVVRWPAHTLGPATPII